MQLLRAAVFLHQPHTIFTLIFVLSTTHTAFVNEHHTMMGHGGHHSDCSPTSHPFTACAGTACLCLNGFMLKLKAA
jgi:hypothetical protein